MNVGKDVLKTVWPEKRWRGTVIKLWKGKAEDSACDLALARPDYEKAAIEKPEGLSKNFRGRSHLAVTEVLVRSKSPRSREMVEAEIRSLREFVREHKAESCAYAIPDIVRDGDTPYAKLILKQWWEEVLAGTGLKLVLLCSRDNRLLAPFFQALEKESIWRTLGKETQPLRDRGGKVRMLPRTEFRAGELGTSYIVYEVGEQFGKGAMLEAFLPHPTNWGMPQVIDPEGANYTTVTTVPRKDVAVFSTRAGGFCGWRVRVEVVDDALAKGDRIIITLGDRYAKSPGNVAQTNVSEPRILRIGGDLEDARVFKKEKYGESPRLKDSPVIRIRANAPERLRVISPSYLEKGKKFDLTVRVDDACGNLVEDFTGELRLLTPRSLAGKKVRMAKKDRGSKRIRNIVLKEEGTCSFAVASPGVPAPGVSNPCRCFARMPELGLYWGDIHVHTALSDGAGSPDDAYRYAKEANRLDIVALADHDYLGTYWGESAEEYWNIVKSKADEYYRPGEFVTLAGYEYSGGDAEGGHRNVYYFADGGELYPCVQYRSDGKGGFIQEQGVFSPEELHARLKGKKAVVIPHHVASPATFWEKTDKELTPVAEIYSIHGISESHPNSRPLHEYVTNVNRYGSPTSYREALRKGFKLGVIGGTDGHDGFPGFSYSWGPFRGGLMAVFMEELTREALWESLWKRRCYATTGERIIVSLDADGHRMGEEFALENDIPHFKLRVAGTDTIAKIDLLKNASVHRTFYPGKTETTIEFADEEAEPGKESSYYFQVIQADGEMAWTSPVWITRARGGQK